MAKELKKIFKSFTLIELIIVIAIIAVLGATAFLLLTQWMSKGRDAQRISDLSTIKTALDIALTKNDQLPLPDEAKELLYSGTEILYQGLFGDQVVKSIGTLNKVPRDRVNGNYEYSLLYDMKTYKLKASMENEQYKMTLVNKVSANSDYYRYIGKDIKAVVVDGMFVYLPSMFITGYDATKKYDLYNNTMDVFVGDKAGEYKTGVVLPISDLDEIKVKLSELGLSETQVNQIVTQGTGQPQLAAEQKCDGALPDNTVLNGTQKSGVSLTYNEIPGECTYKCKDGYYLTGGNCALSNIVLGDASVGFEFFVDGTQVYPKSCNDLIVSTSPDYKNGFELVYNGTKFVDGVYKIKPSTTVESVYCNFSLNNNGRGLVLNLDTNDGQVKNYSSPYRFDSLNYGTLGNPIGSDYKNGKLFNIGTNNIIVVIHNEGSLMAYKEYSLNEINKSLFYYFGKGKDIRLTNATLSSFGIDVLHENEPTIKQNADLYLNSLRGSLDHDRVSIGGTINNNEGGGLGVLYDYGRTGRPLGEGQLLNCIWSSTQPCTIGDDNLGSNAEWNAKSGLQYDYSFYIK